MSEEKFSSDEEDGYTSEDFERETNEILEKKEYELEIEKFKEWYSELFHDLDIRDIIFSSNLEVIKKLYREMRDEIKRYREDIGRRIYLMMILNNVFSNNVEEKNKKLQNLTSVQLFILFDIKKFSHTEEN